MAAFYTKRHLSYGALHVEAIFHCLEFPGHFAFARMRGITPGGHIAGRKQRLCRSVWHGCDREIEGRDENREKEVI
jgi:hypothetical protein